jgi:hypothetical protein
MHLIVTLSKWFIAYPYAHERHDAAPIIGLYFRTIGDGDVSAAFDERCRTGCL